MRHIKLYWWRDASGTNFGDDVSPIIVERISGRSVEYASLESCDMIGVGSLIDRALRRAWKRTLRRPFSKIRVWGSGSLGDISPRHGLDIVAVRGPATRSALNLPGTLPLGDPALLLPRIVKEPAKRYRWGIVPHITHRREAVVAELAAQPGAKMIDLGNDDTTETAREIAACDFVISSSLHGLIVADAYGIPNVWLQVGPPLVGGKWKFHDYFASVGRRVAPLNGPTIDLQEIESQAAAANPAIVNQLADGLERAFPK
jgi:hypothetical protein